MKSKGVHVQRRVLGNIREESVLVQILEVKTRKQIRTEDFVETCPVLKTCARVSIAVYTPHAAYSSIITQVGVL